MHPAKWHQTKSGRAKIKKCVNWQAVSKQKGVQQMGINKGCVYMKWLQLWFIVLCGHMLVRKTYWQMAYHALCWCLCIYLMEHCRKLKSKFILLLTCLLGSDVM
jgi:hypothetical protein